MTVDEVRIRDWSSDVCSSDLCAVTARCGTRSPRRPEWRAGWAGAAFPGQARAPTGQGSALRGRSRLRRIHVARQRPHDIAALRVPAEVEVRGRVGGSEERGGGEEGVRTGGARGCARDIKKKE